MDVKFIHSDHLMGAYLDQPSYRLTHVIQLEHSASKNAGAD